MVFDRGLPDCYCCFMQGVKSFFHASGFFCFRFLDTLGTLFHFVTQDVKSKVDILLAFLKSAPDHYRTINGMLNYEVENSLTKTKVCAAYTVQYWYPIRMNSAC